MLGWFKKKKIEKEAPPQEHSPDEIPEEGEEEISQPVATQEEEEHYGTGIFGSYEDKDEDESSAQEASPDDIAEPHLEEVAPIEEIVELPEPEQEPVPETEAKLEPEPETPPDVDLSVQEDTDGLEPSSTDTTIPSQELALEPETDTHREDASEAEEIDSDAAAGEAFLAGLELFDESEQEIETVPEPEPTLEQEQKIATEALEEITEITPTEAPPTSSESPVDQALDQVKDEKPTEPVFDPESVTDVSQPEAETDVGEDFLAGLELYDKAEHGEQILDPILAQEGEFFQRLSDRLSRTRESFVNQMDLLFLGKKEIDADLLDDLEELLITSDLGVATTTEIIEHAKRQIKRDELSDPQALKGIFKEKIRSYIVESTKPAELVMPESGPFVIMVIGVNGVGKTTTIGKITHKFIASGQSVLLVAADTFRAAAVSQLQIWGKRNNVEVVSGKEGIDPSSVVYDAMERAKEKDYDVVLVDTAGRLHTKTNLMEELKKVKRVMGKRLEGAPHEILLVIDATTGQNGVSQARLFNEAVGVTGLTLTKLDGTAKGGIVANICRDLNIPIRFIGIGEQIDDLRDFDPDEFIEALFHEAEASESD